MIVSQLLGRLVLGAVPSGSGSSGSYSFVDVLSITDTVTCTKTIAQPLQDTLVLTDNLLKSTSYAGILTDSLTLSDSIVAFINRVLVDTLTLTDVLNASKSQGLTDNLSIGDSLSKASIAHRTIGSQLSIIDSLSRSLLSRQTIVETLSLSDTLTGFISRTLEDTLSLTDTLLGVSSKSLLSTLALSDSISCTKVKNVSLADGLLITDSVKTNFVLVRFTNEELTITDSISCYRQVNFTDTLTVTDTLIRERIAVPLADSLTFTDSLSVTQESNRSLTELLSIQDGLTRSSVAVRNLGDTLTFKERLVGFKNQRRLVMRGSLRTISLPAPEFNDFQAQQNKLVVGRVMNGDFRTYVKRSKRLRHNWRFIVDKRKKDELQAFFLEESDSSLYVLDWRGQEWTLKLYSNVLDFTEVGRWEPCGNKFEITLEFEGVRYYGD